MAMVMARKKRQQLCFAWIHGLAAAPAAPAASLPLPFAFFFAFFFSSSMRFLYARHAVQCVRRTERRIIIMARWWM